MARVVVPVTLVAPAKASLTTSLSGSDNDLVFTAVAGGQGGNSINIIYSVSGANTPLSVSVDGFVITVHVATDGGSAATSTSAQVMAAIQANADASALVTVANATSNSGAGVVTALSITPLTEGSLGITQPSSVVADATNKHYFTGNDGQTMLEVVSSDGSSRTVTVQYAPGAAGGATAVTGSAETIAAGATRILGPFRRDLFNQNASGDVYFDPSVATTLTFRAYRLSQV